MATETEKHTEGQLKVVSANDDGIFLVGLQSLVGQHWVAETALISRAEMEDFRRLAAAWNACEGLSTEYIEGLCVSELRGQVEDLSDVADALRVSRDQALADLQAARAEAERLRAGLTVLSQCRHVSGSAQGAFRSNLAITDAVLAGADVRDVETMMAITEGTWEPAVRRAAGLGEGAAS